MPGPEDHSPDRAAGDTPEWASRRAELPIPVQAKIGLAPAMQSRLRNVSVSGFRVDWRDTAETGEAVIARFEGYPGVCPAFILHGHVARVIAGSSPGIGVAIDRTGSSAESLEHFRQLVLHYMRHRPLLAKQARDFFEGSCEACEWIGRVGARSPVCPRCGERVRPLDPGQ